MDLARRDILKMGLVGGAAAMVPLERLAFTQSAVAPQMAASRLPKPFTVPFARPPVLQPVRRTATHDVYRITMKRKRVQILPDVKTEIWGYNGMAPGPTIVAHRGRDVKVLQRNEIHHPDHRWTSVHLHGNASKPQYDGYASDVTKPGQHKLYHYPHFQPARTLWYHDHGIGDTALNAHMGLAAFYITHDRHELSLPIPHGRYDVPLMLKDATFARNGNLIFDTQGNDTLQGHVILVNGRPWPRMKVDRRKYRFRVLNASVSRSYELALSSGGQFTVIGTDGGLMPHPVRTHSLLIGMAERYEIVIDFAKYKKGDRIILRNRSPENNQDFENTDVVMRFDVVDEPTTRHNNAIPDALAPHNEVMKLRERPGLRVADIDLVRKGGLWTVNGTSWHEVGASGFKFTVANPRLNETQIWRITNNSNGWFHPLHLHLIDFKVLDRNGRKPRPYEMGPKDVVYVGEGETVRILAKFGPQRGRYMIHCHNLVHEDHDMMSQFEVGHGGPDPMLTAPARPGRVNPPLH